MVEKQPVEAEQRTGGDGDEQCVGAERPAESLLDRGHSPSDSTIAARAGMRRLEHGSRGSGRIDP